MKSYLLVNEMCSQQQEVRSRQSSEQDILLPGFRFHPTDEELVAYYLRRKVMQRPLQVEVITQLDIYKFDPWDLPKMAAGKGEKEWYFFCPRDRKYRNSARPNRVTGAGFWKATGTDRPIYSGNSSTCIGLKKSLVFYKGRAAKGIKTDWMMHEFRLPPSNDASTTLNKMHPDESCPPQDAWAVCRIFKKSTLAQRHASACQHWATVRPENMIMSDSVGGISQLQGPECSSTPELELEASSHDRAESSSEDLELELVDPACASMMQTQNQQKTLLAAYSQQTNRNYISHIRQLSEQSTNVHQAMGTWPMAIQNVNSFGELVVDSARSSQRSNITNEIYPTADHMADTFLSQRSSPSMRGALDFVNCMLNSPRSAHQFMNPNASIEQVRNHVKSIFPDQSAGPKLSSPMMEKFRKRLSLQIPEGTLSQPACGLPPSDLLSPIFPLECM